tara:strand:+ start:552 stop:1130 length:579 start_codon:yes stop_codon:yes gene_type:complete
MPSTEKKKGLQRIQAKQQRAKAFALNPRAGEQVCQQLLDSKKLKTNQIVAVYWPLGDELDPMPLLNKLHELGHQTLLPVMLGAGKPLLFRKWESNDSLKIAQFGTYEPFEDKPVLKPDVILAPLLAFDRHGYRLGYGGGFYDRTIENLRQTKSVSVFGVAYAAQEMNQVVRGPFDQPLDAVLTELEVISFNP